MRDTRLWLLLFRHVGIMPFGAIRGHSDADMKQVDADMKQVDDNMMQVDDNMKQVDDNMKKE